MVKNPINRTCPICGNEFVDYSRSHNKYTCSKKCRFEYYNQQNPESHHDRKLQQRLYVLCGKQNVIVTDEEIKDISEKIKLGICQICGKEVTARKWLHIDHCHKTNKYRDVLCQSCNFTIGFIEKYPDSISLCQDYIKKHNVRLENYMNVKKHVASELLKFRQSQGWSVRQMTEKLNEVLPASHQIAFPTVAAWEQGRNPVSFYLMFYLSHKAKGELKAFAGEMCRGMVSQ